MTPTRRIGRSLGRAAAGAPRPVRSVFRGVWRFLKRVLVGGSPPTLRAVLYRVILLAILIPYALTAWSHYSGTRASSQILDSFELSQENQPPASDEAQIKKIIRKADNEDIYLWPLDGSEKYFLTSSEGLGLPSSTLSDVERLGYAYGSYGQQSRFVAWRSGGGGGMRNGSDYNVSVQFETFHLVTVDSTSSHWYEAVGTGFLWLMNVFWTLVILSIIASPAAAFFEGYIAGPILRLVDASRVVARGKRPEALPEMGCAELILLNRSFNEMATDLENSRSTERLFLMSVSHELKTPLTAIEGYAELLEDGAVAPAEAAPVFTSEAGRLRRLVDDLLDMGRMNQDAFSIRHEAVALDVVVAEVMKRHAARAKELGVMLASHVVEPLAVIGDEDRLVQATSNLVENALRCTPAGKSVTVGVVGARIIVTDEGPGLPAEDLPRAFERFYLHDRLKGRNDVGNGLGLAIVKELVDRMGGEVSVESERGAGASFALELQPYHPTWTEDDTSPGTSAANPGDRSAPFLMNVDKPPLTRVRRWTYYIGSVLILGFGVATRIWVLFAFAAVLAWVVAWQTRNRLFFWILVALTVPLLAALIVQQTFAG
jgi:signal transduction histidine kinase